MAKAPGIQKKQQQKTTLKQLSGELKHPPQCAISQTFLSISDVFWFGRQKTNINAHQNTRRSLFFGRLV